jgi:hypothetical protein
VPTAAPDVAIADQFDQAHPLHVVIFDQEQLRASRERTPSIVEGLLARRWLPVFANECRA